MYLPCVHVRLEKAVVDHSSITRYLTLRGHIALGRPQQ